MTLPWPQTVWQPSEQTRRRTRRGAAHAVSLQVAPPGVLESAWQRLEEELSRDPVQPQKGVLLDGGAALRRTAADSLDVDSGGEDVLDSLSYSINQTLWNCLQEIDADCTVLVTGEGRPSVS